MKGNLVLAAVCLGGYVIAGCNDETTGPGDAYLAALSGDWELHSLFVGSTEHIVPDNNTFYYINEAGDMCSLWRTAYGEYLPGFPGKILSGDLVLREYVGENYVDWQLEFVAMHDTLIATAIVPLPHDADRMVLGRATDAPEAICFSGSRYEWEHGSACR